MLGELATRTKNNNGLVLLYRAGQVVPDLGMVEIDLAMSVRQLTLWQIWLKIWEGLIDLRINVMPILPGLWPPAPPCIFSQILKLSTTSKVTT